MLTLDALRTLTAALVHGADFPAVEAEGAAVRLAYPSAEAHAARVSLDVEAARELPGFVLASSESTAAAPLAVVLRYAPAPAVEAPRPVAPAPVPASPSRRR